MHRCARRNSVGNVLVLTDACCFRGDPAQLQFSSPKTHHPDRALVFHVMACLIVNTGTLLYHLFMPLVKSPRGMIIDFIGSSVSCYALNCNHATTS